MIREKARANSCGKMEESMMVSGKTGNNMVVVNSLLKKDQRKWVNGSMAKKISGYLE